MMDKLLSSLGSMLPGAVSLAGEPVGGPYGDLHGDELNIVRRAGPVRRSEFRAGRIAARRAMGAQRHFSGSLLARPEGDPIWPPGLVGSISHAKGWAIAATASRSQVTAIGLDLEGAEPLDTELADLVRAPEERSADEGLIRVSGGVVVDAAKLCFVAKEAWYKAIFPDHRLFIDFHDVVVRVDAARCRFTVERARDAAKEIPFAPPPAIGHFTRSRDLLAAVFVVPTPLETALAPPAGGHYFPPHDL